MSCNKISSKRVFSFILKMVESFPKSIAVMFLIAIIWAIDVSLRPYILKIILNRISESTTIDIVTNITLPVLAYFFMTVFISVVFRIHNYFINMKLIPELRKKIASSVFGYCLKQSSSYYQDHFAGSLAKKMNDLMNNIPDIIQTAIDYFFSRGLTLVVAIFILWQVNYKFALIMFIWVVIFIITLVFYSKKLVYFSTQCSEIGSTINGKIVDILSNISLVKSFSRENFENKSVNNTLQDYQQTEEKYQKVYFYICIIFASSFVILQALSLYFLIKGRQENTVSIGDFALILTLNIKLTDLLWELTRELPKFLKNLGEVMEALEVIMLPLDHSSNNIKDLIISKGSIVFDKVHFYYKASPLLFKDKSVNILPKQKVGLVGYSGSGKSTFVNLIIKLFNVTSGRILIDDQDISNATQNSLNDAITIIPQDVSLFNRTLMENIRYGSIEATEEQVIAASKQANAHEFITSLPNGYDSIVGERGVKLSAGQRQRIAITRAILKNSPILILDEATSHLDSLTENMIQKSLVTLMQGKTAIVIAHRLSTLLYMDRILVFKEGKIIEDGTHEELFVQGGLYKMLWETQVGGFIQNKTLK
jgi:ATP-binding cassette subfamily B protein